MPLPSMTFDPATDMAQQGTLSIFSDDPDEAEYRVVLIGNRAGLSTGDEAPDFTFSDLNGFSHTLSAQRGKPVLLAYFATF